MTDSTFTLLLGTAVLTAVFHTAIPDHWLPFVLVGRARNWSPGRTASVSGLSALIHVLLSVLLGLAGLWIGREIAQAVGRSLEHAGAPLLVVFGLAYAAWAWHKGGHFHPGGALFHRGRSGRECEGQEGPSHPEHLHYHADGGLIPGGAGPGALALAVLVGMNPCILVLPILVQSASRGPVTVALVTGAYAVTTTALMVGLSVGGVVATRKIRLPGAARHMEAASGLLIAALGVALAFLE